MAVASPTIQSLPLFGVGPDRFVNAYLQFKPQSIDTTLAWMIDFPNGSGFLLTSLVTQGIVGFALLIIFIVLFFILGVRSLRKPIATAPARAALAVSFFTAAFLWLMMIVVMPSHALLLLTFIFTGLFISQLIENGQLTVTKINWHAGGVRQLFIAGIIIVIVASSVLGSIVYTRVFIAQKYLQSGIEIVDNISSASTTSDALIAARHAKDNLIASLTWEKNDVTYEALAQVDVYMINAMIANASSTPDQSFADSVSSLVNESIGYAKSAEKIDPGNFYNYIAEANVSETAAGLQIPDAGTNARSAYLKALAVNPFSPSTYLSLAKLDYFEGSTTLASNDLSAALQLRPAYSDALFEAGVISYEQKDYPTAETAFAQTIKLDASNVNAIYFLGLTLIHLGDTADALTEFTALARVYPDNQQVIFILNALKAGKSPFSTSAASQNLIKW